jgi:hypothetical protein
MLEKISGIREVSRIAKPANVGGVRLHGPRIIVRAHQDCEAGLSESEAQSARATEEIDRRGAVNAAKPSADPREIARIGRAGMSGESENLATVMRYRGAALGLGWRGGGHVAVAGNLLIGADSAANAIIGTPPVAGATSTAVIRTSARSRRRLIRPAPSTQ